MLMHEDFSSAVRLHQQGHLYQAAQAYQAILDRNPRHADALHLLGVVALQSGDACRAIDLIGRAVALIPNSAAFHANQGEAYRAIGQLDEAIQCCRTALSLKPNYPEAANNLGLLLLAKGDTAAAVNEFRQAVGLAPDRVLSHNNLGNALRIMGDAGGAIEAFRKAVELDVTCAEAHGNLGQLLLEQNQRQEALVHCQEAVRLRPGLAELQNNLGNVLRELSRLEEAKECYGEAMRLNPELAMTYNNMGQALQEDGDLRSALNWYRQALEREPNSPRIQANVASVFEEQENFVQAAKHYQVALRLDPQFAEAHNGLGFTLHQQGKFDEALEAYRTVSQLRPSFAPGHCNLGNLLEELGDLKEAEAGYRTALRFDPELPAAHAQLATLLRGKLPKDDLAGLEEMLARPHLAIGKRLALHFGLAHVLDGRGEYDTAAEHMLQGNALCQELWRKQGQSYDPKAQTASVDHLITAFNPDFFRRTHGFGHDSERPVFIVGLPRSGTTLTEQILSSHPQVFGAGELNEIRADFDAIPSLLKTKAPPIDSLGGIHREAVQQIASGHLARLGKRNDTAQRVVDKMPDNYFYLGLIATLFPRARIIHCRRDLRDVAVSCWMTHFRHIRWAADQEHIATRFIDYRRIMDHWRQVLPVSVLEVDYEETVAELEGVARRLISWCGLAWDPACLAFHRTTRPIRTASVTQVRQPIYQRSVARWKHYKTSLRPLFAALEAIEPNR
jgi:tetratricopeptide (TPR) repeat protein